MPSITDWLVVAITVIYIVATIAICKANIKMDISFKDRLGEYSESLANIFKISYCKLIIFAYNMFYAIQFYKMKYNFHRINTTEF